MREYIRRLLEKIERYCGPLSEEDRRRVVRSAKERFKRYPELRKLFDVRRRAVVDPSQEHPF